MLYLHSLMADAMSFGAASLGKPSHIYSNRPSPKDPLTKKQVKARKKAKIAKASRKRNRKK